MAGGSRWRASVSELWLIASFAVVALAVWLGLLGYEGEDRDRR